MKTLDPGRYVVTEIDEADEKRFEAFLDRNFPGWRAKNMIVLHPMAREWSVSGDDIRRSAFYRVDFVEIKDGCDRFNEESQDVEMHFLKHMICDIDGDLTPVARWQTPSNP